MQNICILMSIIACDSNIYFMTMTTREHNYVRVQLLKSRSSMKGFYENYVNLIGRHSGRMVVMIYTSNEPECFRMKEEVDRLHMTLITSCSYSSESNNLAKRMDRILAEKPRAMIDHHGLKFNYWCNALRLTTH